jgi:hypothetical protein
MIPKIIHFIYPWTEKTRPWSLVNTLAVRLAKKHHPDYEIIVWTNSPTRVPLLGVTVKKCELPTQVGGVDIVWPQYISDVMRLQILLDWGGIYMDTDILTLQPVSELLTDRLVVSWETENSESISNALMISPQGNLFLSAWLDKMPEAMTNETWAYGGVVLPRKLSMNPHLTDQRIILPHMFCCPLDLSRNWLFDPSLKDEAEYRSKESHAIHVFETFWRDIIKDITPEWIDKNDCLFSEIVRS